MAEILLDVHDVSKAFDGKQVVKKLTIGLQEGEIGCLLGPSGCGKTTLLRIIAGFEGIDHGQVRIGDKVVTAPGLTIPPEQRDIGMVFQDYALFPHLSVYDNIAFGITSLPGKQRAKRIGELLELVGLQELEKAYPHEISGGQQQRVALARALAPEPKLLLLDEPFSNLDVTLREKLTVEVRDILKCSGTTALMVTHNQYEAFAVADSVGVLFDGIMQQWDSAYDVYHNPATREVATFVGDGVLLKGVVIGQGKVVSGLGTLEGKISLPCSSGCEVDLLVRPEDVLHVDSSPVRAKIINKSFRGPNILYKLMLANNEPCFALVSSHHNHQIGEEIGIVPEVDNIVAFNSTPSTPSF